MAAHETVAYGTDPLFTTVGSDYHILGYSDAINNGVIVAGIHDQAGCVDYSQQPCVKGANPDIGAYEKSLGGLFQTFNKTNRFAPHRRLH